MVFLHFPSTLTEEELMLQNKYAQLKKKKKQLAMVAAGGTSTANRMGSAMIMGKDKEHDRKAIGAVAAEHEMGGKKKRLMHIPEAKDAKEVAKKLIRSGAIAAIQKSVQKSAKVSTEKSKGFKRSQGELEGSSSFFRADQTGFSFSGLERKLTGLDARAGYQPFSATHGPGGGFDTGGEDMNPEPPVNIVN
jgi:hypothetical protein